MKYHISSRTIDKVARLILMEFNLMQEIQLECFAILPLQTLYALRPRVPVVTSPMTSCWRQMSHTVRDRITMSVRSLFMNAMVLSAVARDGHTADGGANG